jgi:lipopolysaccharide/colanic/teichoic acid biosynthesis glycosyltransferase
VFTYPAYRADDQNSRALDQPVGSLDTFFVRAMPTWKRLIDLAGAGILLLLAAPLLLLAAILVKLSSRGPAFFEQRREGAGGRIFTIYKLRSMRIGA